MPTEQDWQDAERRVQAEAVRANVAALEGARNWAIVRGLLAVVFTALLAYYGEGITAAIVAGLVIVEVVVLCKALAGLVDGRERLRNLTRGTWQRSSTGPQNPRETLHG